jgi:hypothetical protein
MPANSLTPTVIADKNGKITTVHRKDVNAASAASSLIPPPMVVMQSVPTVSDPEYASRLENIAAANQRCRTEGVSVEDRLKLADLSMPVLSSLLNEVSEATDKNVSHEFVMKVRSYIQNNDFAPLVVAEKFTRSAGHFMEELMDEEYSDFGLDNFKDDEDQFRFEGRYVVMSVFETLRDLDLIGYTEVPDAADKRFMTHLRLSCTDEIAYQNDSNVEVQAGLIRLVDEFPTRSRLILEHSLEGLTEPAIRTVLTGEMGKHAMINGAL